MDLTKRLRQWVEYTCRQVIDDYPFQVDAVGGQEHRIFDVYGRPEDMGLSLGAPCRQGTDAHGTTRVAAVSGLEKPLPAAVTGVVLDADATATAGKGEEHAEPRP